MISLINSRLNNLVNVLVDFVNIPLKLLVKEKLKDLLNRPEGQRTLSIEDVFTSPVVSFVNIQLNACALLLYEEPFISVLQTLFSVLMKDLENCLFPRSLFARKKASLLESKVSVIRSALPIFFDAFGGDNGEGLLEEEMQVIIST